MSYSSHSSVASRKLTDKRRSIAWRNKNCALIDFLRRALLLAKKFRKTIIDRGRGIFVTLSLHVPTGVETHIHSSTYDPTLIGLAELNV